MSDIWQKYRWYAVGLVILVLLATVGYFYLKHGQSEEARNQQAQIMSEQYVRDVNALQNQLKLSQQNADMLAQFATKAQAGQVQPATYFTVSSPSLPAAAQQVQERINNKDTTLPPAALEKTDRTVVVPNDTQYKVDVFKYNGYRNWEWAAGVGWHNGDYYVPIGLQRNYSKDAAVAGEIHTDGKSVNGGELKYIRKTDKLFFMF